MFTFTVKLWKSAKMIKFKCKDDLQVFSWWMEKNLEVLVIIKFWPRSHTWTLAENLKIDYFWSFPSFTLELWKSVKIIKFEYKLDLQLVSWWMEQNSEVLVIFKFWPKLDTQTLAEVFILTNFEVCFSSMWSCKSQSKLSNSNVKMICKCFLDEWKRIKKF